MKKVEGFRRYVAYLLTLVFVLSGVMVPAKKVEAYPVNNVFLGLKSGIAVPISVDMTELQAQNKLRENVFAGNEHLYVDKANTFLVVKKSTGFVGIGDGSNYVSTDKDYYYQVTVGIDEDYDGEYEWPADVVSAVNSITSSPILFKYAKLSDVPSSFSVAFVATANRDETYLNMMGSKKIAFYFKVPKTVTHITILDKNNSDVSTDKMTSGPGQDIYYMAKVWGLVDITERGVAWSISGNNSANTKIDSSGKLHIDYNETSDEITVKATSTSYPTKYATSTVTVNNFGAFSSIDLLCDFNSLDLDPKYTEGEVSSNLKQIVYHICSSKEPGTKIDENNVFLIYWNETGNNYYGIEDGTNNIKPGVQYYASINLLRETGYLWPSSWTTSDTTYRTRADVKDVTLKVNGEERDDVLYLFRKEGDFFRIMIPIGTAGYDFTTHGATMSGVVDKEYTGSAITQDITVTCEGKTLVEGTDYDVDYEYNVNPGKAAVYAFGKGKYKGCVTGTFMITEKKPDEKPGDGGEAGGNGGSSGNGESGNAGGEAGSGNGTGGSGADTTPRNTLVTTDGKSQYYKEDGSVARNEWVTINNISYYFGADGNNASSEWVDGKWISEDGSCTYEGELTWKCNSVGWWVEDSKGWYPVSSWQKIDGIWYYFNASGYMAANEYVDGYWLNGDGSCSDDYYLTWKCNSTGWWVEDKSGWWPSSQWLKIDGCWYYFNASGYMVTNQYVDGYWIGADGVCK